MLGIFEHLCSFSLQFLLSVFEIAVVHRRKPRATCLSDRLKQSDHCIIRFHSQRPNLLPTDFIAVLFIVLRSHGYNGFCVTETLCVYCAVRFEILKYKLV